MIRSILTLFIAIFLWSCAHEFKIVGSCTKENILDQCKSKYKKIIDENTRVVISENDSSFQVDFLPIDINIYKTGQGGYIKISKKDCKVIEKRFSQ